MTNYTVTSTFTFEVTDPGTLRALAAMSGASGGDERAQIEAAVSAGLKELPPIAKRYGFAISDSSATVTPG